MTNDPMTERTPEEIAAGLTEAQWRLIFEASPFIAQSARELGLSNPRAREACDAGILKRTGRGSFLLAPLGERIRTLLIEKESRRG